MVGSSYPCDEAQWRTLRRAGGRPMSASAKIEKRARANFDCAPWPPCSVYAIDILDNVRHWNDLSNETYVDARRYPEP